MRLPYCGAGLDRAASVRGDAAAVAALAARRDARTVPMWRDRCLRVDRGGLPAPLTGATARAALDVAGPDAVLLGLDGAVPVFAVDLSGLPEDEAVRLCRSSGTADLRAVVGMLPARDAAVLAHAKGLLHWAANARHCGRCGAATVAQAGGAPRQCTDSGCGHLIFPRIEPAVIVAVSSAAPPARCLLARHAGAAPGAWATVAGFVEVGESLEDAVRREVAEETGVVVGSVSYAASQAWPFPSGLMVGFDAVAAGEDIDVDGREVLEARWFTPAEVSDIVRCGRSDSIEQHLLLSWLARTR